MNDRAMQCPAWRCLEPPVIARTPVASLRGAHFPSVIARRALPLCHCEERTFPPSLRGAQRRSNLVAWRATGTRFARDCFVGLRPARNDGVSVSRGRRLEGAGASGSWSGKNPHRGSSGKASARRRFEEGKAPLCGEEGKAPAGRKERPRCAGPWVLRSLRLRRVALRNRCGSVVWLGIRRILLDTPPPFGSPCSAFIGQFAGGCKRMLECARKSARQPLYAKCMQRKVRAPQSRMPANGRAQQVARPKATESATESRPPMASREDQARVKRRGKSSPRPWRHGRHGKPHPGQGQIGKR